MGKLTDPRNMKQPAAPIVGNTSTKQGPHANAKASAVPGKRSANIGPNGKLAGRSESPAVTTRTEAPMKGVSPAKKLYPSSR
ncbi:hypothetical protein [Burkholderia sp. RF2-non_BP3]|uniref:hypothetical protein n=1 Tax=Burkholderia sp. RF2-non_BP3 TaxID=1637844 RepID=UPI0012E3856F|nr:hypothetical protein [Burkholderia sp. RF2-non_BP3]